MTHELVFRSAARAEFDHAADWYESKKPGLGILFTEEIHSLLQTAAKFPNRCPIVLADVRKLVARKFPFFHLFSIKE